MNSIQSFPLIFDGHNDTVQQLATGERNFFERSERGHVDYPRALEGRLGGAMFALFIRPQGMLAAIQQAIAEGRDTYAAAVAWDNAYHGKPERESIPPLEYSQAATLTQLGTLLKLEPASDGRVHIARTAEEVECGFSTGTFQIVLHLEGAEALDADGNALAVLHAAGVRSVGLVHSRSNIFGHGVFGVRGGSPDTGEGLTDAGKQLVRDLNRYRMIIDLAHLNLRGFWDVASISDAPLVATHSNAWALAPSMRNLTDDQLAVIAATKGLVGVNVHVAMLRSDSQRNRDTPISLIADHIDYLVDKLGIDGVAIGTDFDGATTPSELDDVTGFPKLMQVLRDRGYRDEDLVKIAHQNWIRIMRATWGA